MQDVRRISVVERTMWCDELLDRWLVATSHSSQCYTTSVASRDMACRVKL